MFAAVDWAVLIPGTITSLTGFAALVLSLRIRREQQVVSPLVRRNAAHLESIVPQVAAIDRAVNQQPIGTSTMVDNVHALVAEQGRVADELAASQLRADAVPDDEAGAADDEAAASSPAG